jgi:Icc-related predicted phosphoesterase
MSKKFKILAAADIHGDAKLTRELAKRAEKENVDLVVLCGDLVGNVETKDIIKPFQQKNKKVLIIPGNHESFATIDFLAELYGVRNIHGYSVKYENIGFFGAGGTSDMMMFPGAISENELFTTLKKAYTGLQGIEKKIMVTHMHPSGSASEFSGIPGSKAITKAIKQFKPDILLHGHIHEAGGIEDNIGDTRIINVGRKGTVIEV